MDSILDGLEYCYKGHDATICEETGVHVGYCETNAQGEEVCLECRRPFNNDDIGDLSPCHPLKTWEAILSMLRVVGYSKESVKTWGKRVSTDPELWESEDIQKMGNAVRNLVLA